MREFTECFEVGNTLVQYGCRKKRHHEMEIEFKEVFREQPAVTVTPFWEHQHRGVGHAETLEAINANSFVVNSGNAANNYYVTWTAIGPKV